MSQVCCVAGCRRPADPNSPPVPRFSSLRNICINGGSSTPTKFSINDRACSIHLRLIPNSPRVQPSAPDITTTTPAAIQRPFLQKITRVVHISPQLSVAQTNEKAKAISSTPVAAAKRPPIPDGQQEPLFKKTKLQPAAAAAAAGGVVPTKEALPSSSSSSNAGSSRPPFIFQPPPPPSLVQENRARAGPAVLTHLISADHFYLRLNDPKTKNTFDQLGPQLADHYRTATPLQA